MEPWKFLDPPPDTISTLKPHKRTHKCSDCGKSFACWSFLLTHRKVHVGSGYSQGLEGEKSFSGTDAKDLRSHPSQKPYKYVECDICFAQKSQCRRHQKIQNGERLLASSLPLQAQGAGPCEHLDSDPWFPRGSWFPDASQVLLGLFPFMGLRLFGKKVQSWAIWKVNGYEEKEAVLPGSPR
ncbi:hypothetical protein NXF25_004399 [Crotalus adamanteus]|uniref:C2H2-type domain-containing protein n=1 Tax=Crotalus adamanteus TaxID=8729 RepID=A0AAW1BUC0_CROAD